MEEIISKELLSEVLEIEVENISLMKNDISQYIGINEVKGGGFKGSINIYELAHKCKEWAYDSFKMIITPKFYDYTDPCYDCTIEYGLKNENKIKAFAHPDFISKTEPKTIFKACEWILNQKATNV